jgi:hypothetical protein
VVSFTPLPLYPQYPLYMRLGEPQIQVGRYREETNWYNGSEYNTAVGFPSTGELLSNSITFYNLIFTRLPKHVYLRYKN